MNKLKFYAIKILISRNFYFFILFLVFLYVFVIFINRKVIKVLI